MSWMRHSHVSLLCRRIYICCYSVFDEQTHPRNRLYSVSRCTYIIPILKSDSEIPMCYVYATERKIKYERKKQRKRDTTCTCVERSCYNLSVEFFDPASFHSPGGHFLLSSRISSRNRNMMHSWRFPDPASHPNFRSTISSSWLASVTTCTTRIVSVLSLCTWIPFTQSIHPISVFRYIDSHLAMRRNDALHRDS